MRKMVISIIILAVIILGIGALFVLQKLSLPKQSLVQEPKSKNLFAANNYTDSPFGFLAQYIDSSITRPAYSAYGGFLAIQKLYKDIGVHWDRGSGRSGGAIWGALEKNVDGYRSVFDKYVKTATDNNVNLLITISPAYSESEGEAYLPSDLNAYAKFVEKLVSDYPLVKYWQIHNEVNGGIFWKDTPQNYAKLVRATSDAIRKNCPDCKIVLGSSINVDASGKLQSITQYFEPVLQELNKNGKKYFDIFDYHFFAPAEYTPDSYYLALSKGIEETKNLLGKYGYGDADIWTTETMLFTTDGMKKNEIQKLPESYRSINENQQARAVIKTYISGLANGVKKIFWNKLTEGSWFDFMFNRAGLIRNPSFSGSDAKKLSYYTYKKMVEILEGSDWKNIQKIQESDGVYVYKFIKNNKSIWVAWNDNPDRKQITISGIASAQIKLTEAVPKYETGSQVTDYNTAFNTSTKSVTGGKVAIALGDRPVFVEE